jgi:Uma2 family endonuclease
LKKLWLQGVHGPKEVYTLLFGREIFSKSTQLKDRNTKFNLYEFCGVKYYLMADPDAKSAEIYELIDNKYKQISAPFHFKLNESCSIDFDLHAALES